MMKTDYQIKSGNITSNSEETSAISKISYEIENANDNGLKRQKVKQQIDKLKEYNKFPKNLKYIDSYTDPLTGTTATAFLNKDTGKVTVGMTGTNIHDEVLKKAASSVFRRRSEFTTQDFVDGFESVKDIGADLNIALHSVTDKDLRYRNTQQFIENLQKYYDIDTITGHSLGGRDAIILGISNHIKNVIVYNPAPLTVKNLRKHLPFSFKEDMNDQEIEDLVRNYDGNILRIISDEDWLDNSVKGLEHITAGNKLIIKNGEGHSIDGFLKKFAQEMIKSELRKLKVYQEENNKIFKLAINKTENRLEKVNLLRMNWIQVNGGILSSSQQKVLENLTALSIAEGLSQLIKEESQRLEKVYQEMSRKFSENWKESEKSGVEIGSHLSYHQVLSALDAGNITEHRLETHPKRKISNKLKQLKDVSRDYNDYIAKIKKSIREIVANDQILANQISGII